MGRIVAFGCSHTYGMGLNDSFVEGDLLKPGASPSNKAWPSLLADKLGYDCTNQSIPGGSNLEILYNIFDFKFQEGDKVVVGWTTPARDVVFNTNSKVRIASFLVDGKFSDQQIEEIVPNLYPEADTKTISEVNKKYFQVHSDADMLRRSWVHQYAAGLHLNSKNIDFYFGSAWGWGNEKLNIENFIQTKNFLNDLHKRGLLDFAEDGMHMGPNAQESYAQDVFNSVDW